MNGAHGFLFTFFNSSWKKFKTQFFWVRPNPVYSDNKHLFYKLNNKTTEFHLYWRDIVIIDKFLRRMNIKEVLDFPYSGDIEGSLTMRLKLSAKERKKMINALNGKNPTTTAKLGIIKILQQKIIDHEKLISAKSVENEKLFPDMENLNKKFNEAMKDLVESRKTTTTLNNQLLIKEKKKVSTLKTTTMLDEEKKKVSTQKTTLDQAFMI
ncbi:hypothetical protein GmHk_12G034857 [Glycine max]|nr:hypothetical protein GmHk_12G034857 [Glycine max]